MEIPFVHLPRQTTPLHEEIMAAIDRVVRSGHYILGDEVQACEQELAAYLGVPYAIGVNSCTDALTLAVRALAPRSVIVPAMTFVATAAAVVLGGATPLFADIDPDTGMLTEDTITAVWPEHERTGIMPVHLYGAPQPLSSHRWLHSVIIEDAAGALGASFPDGQKVGSRGTVGCFSFVPTNNLGASGDGGLMVIHTAWLNHHLRALRDHGRISHHNHCLVGTNSRLDALQAAILRVKLPYLDQWNTRRRQIVAYYQDQFAPYEDRIRFPSVTGTGVYRVCVVRVLGHRREAFANWLRSSAIEVTFHYPLAVPDQPAFQHYILPGQRFPAARQWAQQCLTLPNFPEMTDGEVEYVAESVVQWAQRTLSGDEAP